MPDFRRNFPDFPQKYSRIIYRDFSGKTLETIGLDLQTPQTRRNGPQTGYLRFLPFASSVFRTLPFPLLTYVILGAAYRCSDVGVTPLRFRKSRRSARTNAVLLDGAYGAYGFPAVFRRNIGAGAIFILVPRPRDEKEKAGPLSRLRPSEVKVKIMK